MQQNVELRKSGVRVDTNGQIRITVCEGETFDLSLISDLKKRTA